MAHRTLVVSVTFFALLVLCSTAVAEAPLITVAPRQLTFAATGTANPAAQTVAVSFSGGGSFQISWTATVSTSTGGNWLSIAPASGSGGGNVAVSVNRGSLADGLYQGTILFAAPQTANSPQAVSVLLALGAQAYFSLDVTPGQQSVAAGTIGTYTINVTSSGGFSSTVNLSCDGLPAGATCTFSPNPAAVGTSRLTVSTTTATPVGDKTLTIVGTSGSLTRSTTAVLSVTPAPSSQLDISPRELRFTAQLGQNPGTQTLSLSASGGGSFTFPWSVTASTNSGGNWLSVTPASGTGTSTLRVAVNSANLAVGAYAGTVTAVAASSPNNSVTAQVALTVGEAHRIFDNGVVNGASFAALKPVAPGSIASLFGSALAGETAGAAAVPLPTVMVGVRVLVNGTAAPLFFVSAGQINFQIPVEVSGATASIAVERNGVLSSSIQTPLAPAAAGIFSVNQSGAGPGAILDAQFALVSASNRVRAGDVIQIFCTGLGPTLPAVASGQAAPSSPPARVFENAFVKIGGVNAVVQFAGLAPGFVGLYQVNAVVPAGTAPSDAVPVTVALSGAESESNTVTIAVYVFPPQ